MSPSGFPLLQVMRAEGTVNVILFPVTSINILSLPTVNPKLVHDGISIVSKEIQVSNVDPSLIETKLGAIKLVSSPQS